MANYKKEHVLIGAGKLGRGYLADLFGAAGYHLIFMEYSEALVKALNKQGYYTLFRSREDGTGTDVIKFEGYEAYCTETEYDKCVDILSKANTASIHTYQDGFEAIGHMLGDAVKKRVAEKNNETLDVFISVNFLHPDQVLKNYMLERLSTKEEGKYIDEKVGLIQTLPYRGGYPSSPEMLAQDPLAVAASDYPELPVDQDAFRGPVPEGINFLMLNRMSDRLNCKIWTANVRGAVAAAIAKHKGYEFIEQSNEDEYIQKCSRLGHEEAVFGAMSKFGFTEEEFMRGARRDTRASAADEQKSKKTSDTVNRQLFGLKRKLGRTDRLAGPALAALEFGRVPFYLSKATALAFSFNNPEDPDSVEILSYVKEQGIEKAVEKYCELDLSNDVDNRFYQMVVAAYYEAADTDSYSSPYMKEESN